MSNEISVNVSVTAIKGKLDFRSSPQAFKTTMVGEGAGPGPGLVIVTQAGVDIDFSVFNDIGGPGICVIHNQSTDSTNYISYGIRDPETSKFYPLHRVSPGELYPCRIDDNLSSEYGTGTGTDGPSTNKMHMRSFLATCPVQINAITR